MYIGVHTYTHGFPPTPWVCRIITQQMPLKTWWPALVTTVFGRQSLEDQEFKVISLQLQSCKLA